jgi:hypothetical protein
MVNKLSKSRSIPLVFKSKVGTTHESKEIKEIDESRDIVPQQFGIRHKKIAEKYKIQSKNEKPNYDISSNSIKSRGISESLNALKSARQNYTFMNQTSVQNFKLNTFQDARNSLF